MCHPAQRVDRIAIWLSAGGNVEAANVVHHEGSDHELVEVLSVGPFDTPAEVLAACERRLTREPTLW